MTKKLFMVLIALSASSRTGVAQAVQATRSVARAQERQRAETVALVVGRLTGQVAALRTVRAQALQDQTAAFVAPSVGLEQLELLGQQAIERQGDPVAFNRAVASYNAAAGVFCSGLRSIIFDRSNPAMARALALQSSVVATLGQGLAALPPQVSRSVPSVVFAVGGGLVDRPSAGEKRTIPITVSTNLVGQLAGSIVGSAGAGDLANYLKDNAVMSVGFEGRVGKPSASLTTGLGETTIGRLTFWPVLGLEQADSSDNRIPAALRAQPATVGTWSTPLLATAFTWQTLPDFINHVQSEQITPIITVGFRFPYYYPGNAADALGALFTDKLSRYVRTGRLQFIISVDIPLLKVDRAG